MGAIVTDTINRREFVIAAGAMAAAPLVKGVAVVSPRRLRLLVLGGTNFLGPAIVERAMDAGHEVTLFNRGQTNPAMFTAAERLRGDRNPQAPNLAALGQTRSWDAVIDVWPSDPHVVAATAQLLRDRVGRYLFISTTVAYKDLTKANAMEEDALFDDLTNAAAWYEYDKAQCERLLEKVYGDRATVLRSHIINGYRNPSDTMRMWAVRIQRGGEVLAPGNGSDPVQFTDVRDLAEFAVRAAELDLPGAYNIAGPSRDRVTFRQFLDGLNTALGGHAQLTWVEQKFLEAQGLRPFSDLAMWVPLRTARRPGFNQVSSAKAVAAGLTFRPLRETASDELRWFQEHMPTAYEFGVPPSNKGFTRARELAILSEWHRRR
jgi:2'-hydroxyisoflavone reductase